MGQEQSARAREAGVSVKKSKQKEKAPKSQFLEPENQTTSTSVTPSHTPPAPEPKQVNTVADVQTSPTGDGASEDSGGGTAAPGSSTSPKSRRASTGAPKVRLEDFELMAVVGRGQWGKVMMVRKRDSGMIYAMKVIRKEYMLAKNQVSNIRSERQLLELINCPFVVHLHFAFQTDDKLYLILDYINGGELFFHLKRFGRFPEEMARFYTAEMVVALEHLHRLNILYRDLKPENVLLDSQGHLHLVDFGLSKQFPDVDARTYTFCGTPEYLAPEVLTGEGYTMSIDWWCLGSLLYEMLVGLPPFYSDNVEEMYRNILRRRPIEFPADVSPAARDLIMGFLAYDRHDRLGTHGTDAIRAHPFFAGLDWRKLEARELTPPFRPRVESETDLSNVDEAFTSEPPVDSHVERQLDVCLIFDSFSYQNPALFEGTA